MIKIADNFNASRIKVYNALKEYDAKTISSICNLCEKLGANWININLGYLSSFEKKSKLWRFAIETSEKACNLKLVLDSPDPKVLSLALNFCSKPPVLNMATAQPNKLQKILELALSYNLEMIAATITDKAPLNLEERLSLASFIIKEANRSGIKGPQLILDPMVMPLCIPNGELHAQSIIKFLQLIPQIFEPPFPRTSIAISNLITHSVKKHADFASGPFLAAAWGAGLNIVMFDITNKKLRNTVNLCRVFNNKNIFAPDEYL